MNRRDFIKLTIPCSASYLNATYGWYDIKSGGARWKMLCIGRIQMQQFMHALAKGAAMRIEGLPKKFETGAPHYDHFRDAWILPIWSPEFDIVPDGEIAPLVQVQMDIV